MTLVEPRWDDARTAIAELVRPLPSVRLPVESCDGLVLGEEVVALVDLPSFDTAAMDGWAVAGPGPWAVVGESLAGRPWNAHLLAGHAIAIATGAAVPAGADAVIRSEDGTVEAIGGDEVVRATQRESPTHIRPRGEECRADEPLVAAGSVVTPALIGLAAAAGHDDLAVVPRPRVALVLFGDELVTAGIPPRGHVRDSLGPQIPGWLGRLGADVVAIERAPDTREAHVRAIRRAAAAADLVLTTGGTAGGPVDHLHVAVRDCGGELVVDSVAVRPGHPMLAARLSAQGSSGGGTAWLVGLPGNPQSAIVTLMSLGAPIIAGLAGRPPLPQLAEVTCAADVPAPPHEDRLVLGTRTADTFHPGQHLGSGMLRGLAAATGFAVLPPGGVTAGSAVRWLPLPLASE